MARYSTDHKQETPERIVEAAGPARSKRAIMTSAVIVDAVRYFTGGTR
ncbi:hypothetical protein H0B43_34730 [Rhodococcus wratislaviensis]|nr:hypothetical protein [Rhodococcus sp. 4CII]